MSTDEVTERPLQFDEAIILAKADAEPVEGEDCSFLHAWKDVKLGNQQLITLMNMAERINGGLKLFPGTIKVSKGDTIRLRFRQGTINEWDIIRDKERMELEQQFKELRALLRTVREKVDSRLRELEQQASQDE